VEIFDNATGTTILMIMTMVARRKERELRKK
jgi:hypothetical protein